MKSFLNQLRDKNIHIVGVTGAEGSSILRFLSAQNVGNITAHDFGEKDTFEKSFKLWHKGIPVDERNKMFEEFLKDILKTNLYCAKDYLKHIEKADVIFVPQSWRLYKRQNLPLWEAQKKNTPFYSLTRLYLDLAQAQVIGVTGTVGKGSTANILVHLLRAGGKNVYFGGNESWMVQVLDKLTEMKKDDILVLEISHRQLQDGFTRAPNIVVYTNLYPNHLDEVTWEEYKRLKLSLLRSQNEKDTAILNYDVEELKNIVDQLKSTVIFYSLKYKYMNIKSIQSVFNCIMNNNIVHYPENILAAATTASLLGISSNLIKTTITNIPSLPARMEKITTISGITFYDDIKSTTPWATLAALKKLNSNCILICGGRTKGIEYQDFVQIVKSKVKFLYCLKGQLSQKLSKLLPADSIKTFNSLKEAVFFAFKKANKGDIVVVSPAAAFFYTDFVKGKKSLRKIVTSLPPKEQDAEG